MVGGYDWLHLTRVCVIGPHFSSNPHTRACLCDNAARLHTMLRAVRNKVVQSGARARRGREPRVDDVLLRVIVRVTQQVLRGGGEGEGGRGRGVVVVVAPMVRDDR